MITFVPKINKLIGLRNKQEITRTTDLSFCPSSVLCQQISSLLCACWHAFNTKKNPASVALVFPRAFLIFFFMSFSVYSENTRIGVFTDKPFYNPGEIPKIFVSAVNRELESRFVDVHVGLIDPKGKIYEYPDWNTSLSPWFSLIELPTGFEFPAALVADAANFPGGISPGLWHAGVALTKPGTFEFISVRTVPFSMLPPTNKIEHTFGHVVLITENESVTLRGGFLSLSGVFSDAVALIVGPQTEVEQCSLGVFGSNVQSIGQQVTAKFVDAGIDFIVTANSGIQQRLSTIEPVAFINYSTESELPTEFYQTDETYTLSSQGGAVIGAFNASVTAPRPIVVSQPDISAQLIINSNQNLKLQWNGNDGIGEIIVTLLAPNLTSESYMIKCRFADDGNASVPSVLLKQLDEFTKMGLIFSPELSIERTATAQFRTDNETLDYGFFDIRAVSSTRFSFVE